jgi:hypothetical protein
MGSTLRRPETDIIRTRKSFDQKAISGQITEKGYTTIALNTVKPIYLKHVDNWFLKLDLYYFNRYVFKNHLSTRLR